MKKKILGIIAIVAIALTMALNINFSAKNNRLSDLSLANIEALAKKEGDDGGTCGWGKADYGYLCGIDQSLALYYFSLHGGNWCCDSCGNTWYCGNGS